MDSELERLARPLRTEADFVNHPGATCSLGVGEARGNKIPDRVVRFTQSSLTAKPDVTISLTPFRSRASAAASKAGEFQDEMMTVEISWIWLVRRNFSFVFRHPVRSG